MPFSLPIVADANAYLDRSPLGLVIALVLDQQVPMEKAFGSPYVLTERFGHEPTAAELADLDPERLTALFATPPALHRFPKAMAGRVQEVCRVLVEEYDGDAAALWRDVPSAAEVLRRLRALPGFGIYKAQIMLALLGKQYGVTPEGWREAAGEYGAPDTYRSVADIVDDASLAKVREFKKQAKAAAKAGS